MLRCAYCHLPLSIFDATDVAGKSYCRGCIEDGAQFDTSGRGGVAMGETRFTPGRWSIPHFAEKAVECGCGYVLSDDYMGAIATVHFNNGKPVEQGGNDAPPLEQATANAHLIASAPDLYAALERSLDWLASYPGGLAENAYNDARAALQRARGEGQ